MAITIRPHKFLDKQIDITAVSTDSGITIEKEMGERNYSLANNTSKVPFKLKIKCSLPIGWQMCFTPQERSNPPCQMIIAYQSKDSRKKGAKLMRSIGNNGYEGELNLNFSDWRGKLNIDLKLIRDNSIPSVQNFACHKSATIATSEPLKILFEEEIKNTKGGDLVIDWEKFSLNPMLEGAFYYLDYSRSLDGIPVLKLNEEISDELKNIFKWKGKNDDKAKERDVRFMPIVVDVWEQIATKAFEIIRDEDSNLGDLDSIDSPWNDVAKSIALLIHPTMDPDDAEKELIKSCQEEDNAVFRKLVNDHLPVAVQKKADLITAYENTIIKG